MRRRFAARGWRGAVESTTKTGLGPLALVVVVAAGARAATQTEQVSESLPFEWWCATTAAADHTVSSRHSNASALLVKTFPTT